MLDTNPLLNTDVLPSFSTIRAEHLVPAIERIIADSRTTVAKIIASQTPFPTWDDLVLAMDEVKARLEETVQVIDVLSTVHTQKPWIDAVSLCGGLLSEFNGQLAQSTALYELYQALALSPIAALFNSARKRVLEKILLDYHRSGLHLAPVYQQRLRELKDETRLLEQEFSSRVQQATEAWGKHIEDESLLAGLSLSIKQRMANKAQEKNLTGWWLTLENGQERAVMLHAEHRPLRQEVWVANYTRATDLGPQADRLNNDHVLALLLEDRHETARLLGHEHYASLALEGQMTTSADEVLTFLRRELESQRATFARERRELEGLAEAQNIPRLEPWDYEYFAQKVREVEGVSHEALRVYFPLPTVLSRLLQFTRQVFGVEVVEHVEFDRWHPDVRLFAFMENQQTLGHVFIDPYERVASDATLEVFTLRNRRMTAEGRPRLPIAVLRGQFAKGDDDQPCLLDYTQLRMLAHEFGHCLQHVLTGQDYRDISGIGGMGPDLVEFASQVMEQWCFSPQFLVWISGHYQTGEPLPVDMAQGLTRVARTQTSWATANLLLLMLFDIEVHRTQGDGRSPQAVFDALTVEVGHLHWPHGVRPFNSNGLMTSPHASRGYSYKWSGVMASLAFERFNRAGLFDVETGKAFREAFFTQGDARPLRESLNTFLGADTVDRHAAAPVALLRAENTVGIAPLVSLLSTSQQQMIQLNAAVPRPSDLGAQQLKDGFNARFPALAGLVSVENLAVRTVQETLIPLADREPDGPAFKREDTASIPLAALYWQAVSGRLSISELFLDLGSIEIVHTRDSVQEIPAALNSSDAKSALERLLIEARPVSFEHAWERALNQFWNAPSDFSHSRPVGDWLADEFSAQLMAQANIQSLDGTLKPPIHRAVTDYALSVPDAQARSSMLDAIRPGVYELAYTPARWSTRLPVRDCVVLTERDNAVDPGAAVLWRLGEPLELFKSVAQIKSRLTDSGDATGTVQHLALPGNFLTHQVMGLRQTQQADVMEVLRLGPHDGEDISVWLQRLDEAVDIGDRLDLAVPLSTRYFHQKLDQLNEWLRSNRYATGKDRLAWWQASREWQKAVSELHSLPADPVTLATPEAIQAWTRTELERLIKGKYPPADPDRVFLTIEKRIVDPHAPTGSSPYGSGIALSPYKGLIFDRRSLTEWAISNLTSDEGNALNHTEEGPLSFEAIRDLVASANVGTSLEQWITPAARRTQTQWMSLKGKQMRVEVLAAHLSGDLTHDRDNTRLNLVLAALNGLQPQERVKVNGHEVVVYQLRWGDSPLRDILMFGVRELASRPSLTLYTPGAPDAQVFRDAEAETHAGLMDAVVKVLTSTAQMTLWLISKLPLSEQADQIASLESTNPEHTVGEKIAQFVLNVFSPIKFRASQSFSVKGSLAVVDIDLLEALYETQIAHARNAVNMLTVSNAERDSESAQQGRLKGVGLVLGMLSIPRTGRIGGLMGRTVLPTMIGGAAVGAIKDEGGSGSQWLSDFFGAMGEVVTEAGEDLIMNRAGRPGGRRAGKRRLALSTLPRMPDAELRPFRLEGFDGAGLLPEGRDLYRGQDGQGYVKLDGEYYKTTQQGGERFIYTPRNISNTRKVVWENGRWQVEAPVLALGGGPVMSLFRTPETPQQQKYNALLEAYLVDQPNPPRGLVREAQSVINAMPDALAQRLVDENIKEAGVSGLVAYRARISLLTRQRSLSAQHQAQHNTLLYKLDLWSAIHSAARYFEGDMKGLHFSDGQKISMFDTAVPFRNAYYESSGINIVSMPDNLTGAVFIGISPKRGKKRTALDKINKEYNDFYRVMNDKILVDLQAQFPPDRPESAAALERFFTVPANIELQKRKKILLLREEMQARHMPGLLTEIRNKGIPYFIASNGKTQRKLMLTTADDIQDFTKNLAKYTETFGVEAVIHTTAHKVTGAPPGAPELHVVPEVAAVADRFTVNISPLAETQMSYDNFPEAARTKMGSIMDDIRAGRATSKRINGHYWYDMAQLNPGSGRGAWRAAFQRKGDTWVLQGFFDYHTDKAAAVWGD